jgi:hypothetical protein
MIVLRGVLWTEELGVGFCKFMMGLYISNIEWLDRKTTAFWTIISSMLLTSKTSVWFPMARE